MIGKKTPPPEQTHAENFYYQKQMQAKTPMVLVLQDGEEIHGIIEWYDKYCLKVNRIGAQSADLQAQHQVHVQGKRSRSAASNHDSLGLARENNRAMSAVFA